MEVLLVIGGLYLLYLGNLSRSATNLLFLPWGTPDMAFVDGTPTMSAEVLIQNTSNASFTINSLAANVLTDNTVVGNVSSFVAVQVPPNSETPVPITIRFQMIGIVNDIISAFTDGHIAKDVKVEGYANANGYQVPVSFSYHVGI